MEYTRSMTIKFHTLAPSEQAIIRRSAARGRCQGESIGAALRRFTTSPNYYEVLYHRGQVVGIKSVYLYSNEMTYDLTPIGLKQFGSWGSHQRQEFLDKALSSLS
jgi:hypothetical protein